MNRTSLLIFSVFLLVLVGCEPKDSERIEKESVASGEVTKWGDPNYQILVVGAYNFTDYDIYGAYLLPLDKSDLDYAAHAGSGSAVPRDATRWEQSGSSPDLAWDIRWTSPRKFKVWWYRITDSVLYKKSGSYVQGGGMFDPFDPYTTKQTRPGSAWCEGEVEISEKFNEPFGEPYSGRKRDTLILYFYPDGTVRGHLEFAADSEIQLVDIAKRDELPKLKDRACLKEIANPFFGKKRPLRIN